MDSLYRRAKGSLKTPCWDLLKKISGGGRCRRGDWVAENNFSFTLSFYRETKAQDQG